MFWRLLMPWIMLFWVFPAVFWRGIPGKALRVFQGSFQNLSRISAGKTQPYSGYGLKSDHIPQNWRSFPWAPLLGDAGLIIVRRGEWADWTNLTLKGPQDAIQGGEYIDPYSPSPLISDAFWPFRPLFRVSGPKPESPQPFLRTKPLFHNKP